MRRSRGKWCFFMIGWSVSLKSSASVIYCGVKRLCVLLFLGWLVAGCVSAPERSSAEASGSVIQFSENRSVDLSARQDFAAAIKLLHEERLEEGIELLKKVIQTSHNNSAPYINIAIAYSKLGKDELAETNLKKAMEINPRHPVTLNEYALLYRKTGRYVQAKQLYQKLLDYYPEFMPVRKNYGILCELYLNDTACAIQQYEVYHNANPDDEDVKLWLAGLQR